MPYLNGLKPLNTILNVGFIWSVDKLTLMSSRNMYLYNAYIYSTKPKSTLDDPIISGY